MPAISPNGATIIPEYLNRRQEFVTVNRNDLEDLLAYDSDAALFFGIGTFFLSGSVWIVLEQLIGPEGAMISPLVWVCIPFTLFGAFMLWQGWRQHGRKRGRIQRIFEETAVIPTASAGSSAKGSNATTG